MNNGSPNTSARIDAEADPVNEAPKATVLVVEDEPMIRFVLHTHLADSHYNVLLAATGERGFEIYQREPDAIDLVILDLHLPGMSGETCLQRLREVNPNVKVVISSGTSALDDQVKEVMTGASAFVEKPYRLPELNRIIDSVLQT